MQDTQAETIVATVEQLAELLGGKPSQNGNYRCKCPSHPDEHSSLSIKGIDGKILFKCFAGCTFESIVARLEEAGIRIQAASPPVLSGTLGGKTLVAEYIYTTPGWQPICKKQRFEGPDGKTMRWKRWHNGSWITGLDGVQTSGMLYRKGDIRRAIQLGLPVHINEGEKACDLMFNMGMVATCQPMGAGRGAFTREHAVAFSGADVWIWADIDEPGERYAGEVASIVKPFARSVRIVQSKTGGLHDDAYDHFSAGYGLDDAVVRDDLLPETGHRIVYLSDVPPKRTSHLWEPYLPAGKVVLLDADGGTGKTTFSLALAASLSRGVLPGMGPDSCSPVKTLYYGDEDDPGEYRIIYDACGGDPSMMAVCQERFQLDSLGLQRVEDTIREGGFGLVVFDALLYYLAGIVRDSHQSYDVGPAMHGLVRVAAETNVTILAIRHTTKGVKGVEAKHLGLGSVQFRNSARGQLVLRWHPEHPGVRVVTHEKGSILVEQGRPFAWKRHGDSVVWLGTIEDPWSPRSRMVASGPPDPFDD